MRFSERNRRPPKDPVNALLSLGYTMITNELMSLCIAHGLDPYMGFLHGVVYGRPSLALDLVEEFRQPLVDRLTLNLINNQVLTADDFVKNEDNGFVLKPESLRRYFSCYEKRMNEPALKKKNGEPITMRDLLKRQVEKMAHAIKNGLIYKPYAFRG